MPKGGKEGRKEGSEREREREIETPETTRALEGDDAPLARPSGVSATCATQKTVESPRVQFVHSNRDYIFSSEIERRAASLYPPSSLHSISPSQLFDIMSILSRLTVKGTKMLAQP